MKINRALNLVMPIDTDTGKVFVHSVPISREVFETYFLVMSKVFAAIFSQGLGAVSGPRIAYLMLQQIATEMGQWEDVKKGLINEIVRLSNVAYLTDKGWQSLPLYTALQQGILSEDDRHDIEGELIFFTLVASMNKRGQILAIMTAVNGLWGSDVSSLDFTAFKNSLPTSTPDDNSGETPTISSVPV
jgi:hypothetical protein